MPPTAPPSSSSPAGSRLSLDVWAVVLSLSLALLVRFGLIGKVPW